MLPLTVEPAFGEAIDTVGAGGAAGGGATVAVGAEVADVEPPTFEAVTVTFIRAPTSSSVSA
jgi:hypothetical protein